MKLELPGEQAARLIGAALIAFLVIGTLWLVWNGGKNRVDFGNVKAALQTTEESAGISRGTADTVATEQASTWAQAQADEGVIRGRIDAQPRAAGPADPDILRVAREAHARALCAASRVQRADCGDDPAGAAEE
ncbi:MAG TPA: hypothetical protein VLC71_05965 [Thermomonas sp.]|nr:hypothetical protein [Thermomonas sp.]